MPDKPTYREENGTTRVGDALRWLVKNGKNVAPDILEIASDITGIGVLDKLAGKINGSTQLSEADKIMLQANIQMDREEMIGITQRWQADMVSDSWLSKNIRPMVLAFLMACMFVLVMLDSAIQNFIVKPEWVDLLKYLLITVCTAYFGSRGYEKIKKITSKQ